jgi:ELWxxDGT repeat protein
LLLSLTPTLLSDVSPGGTSSGASGFTQINNRVIFAATDPHGNELWASDGSSTGTLLVKDINAGSLGSNPVSLTNVSGTLFFSANDGVHGTELWESDGSAAGTILVKDINPGASSSNPGQLTNVNGTLFFVANDGTIGTELWRSDGTAGGTVLVKDIFTGGSGSYPYSLTNVNGTLFFKANNGLSGGELWKSDGTATGTVLVADIKSGFQGSYPSHLTNVNGTLFFSADNGNIGRELWKSDGTAGGTVLVKDVDPLFFMHPYSSNPRYLTNVNGTLFFIAEDGSGTELWKSDGTTTGTNALTASGTFPSNLTNVNGALFFQLAVPTGSTYNFELWRSDGTNSGTLPLLNIGASESSYAGPLSFYTNASGTLFFVADGGRTESKEYELWESNGTAAGSHQVADIFPGPGGSYPYALSSVGGSLLFTADDGVHGFEPWILPLNTASRTGVTVSVDASLYGQAVTFTSSVAGTALGAPLPTGTVAFYEGSTLLSVALLNSGQATFSTAALAVGTHTIRAVYSGDRNLDASQGDDSQSAQTVNQASSLTVLTSAPSPSVLGQPVTFTATVQAVATSSGTPTGTVDFRDGSTDLTQGGVTLSGNQATFLTAALSVGSHSITAVYSGDSNFLGSSGPGTQTVSKVGTNAVLTSSANPSVLTQAVTFTVTITGASGAGIPTGTVDFRELSSDVPPNITELTPGGVTLNGNQATFSTSALTLGNHTISAVYSGDSTFASSQGDDSASPQVVNNASSATSLVSIPGIAVFAQSVAFVAFVAPVAPATSTPTGTVSFIDGLVGKGGITLAASIGLSGGSASFSTASLAVGSHTIMAVYSGDANLLGSSAISSVAISKATTTTALTSSPNPSVFGQNVIFTATVVAKGGSIPTGTVDFTEVGTDLTPGGVALVAGRATFLTSTLSVGHHTITATYSGNANYTASQANDSAAQAVVNQATSRTVLFSFPDPSVFGQVVPFTVSVTALTPGRGTPTGSVLFTDFTTTIGTVSLSGGRATFTTASLSRGNHAISANYGGDGNFLTSAYTNYGQTVQKAATATTVTPSANPVVVGQTLTLTATVQASSPGAGTSTGTVTFKDITTALGTGTLNASGQVTFTTSALSLGTHAITASYAGDNNFTSSVSPIIAEVISSSARAVTVAQAAPVTGTAVFKDGSAVLGSASSTSIEPTFSMGVKTLATGASAIHREQANAALALVIPNVDNFFAALWPTRQRSTPIPLAKKPLPWIGDWLTGLLGH